MEEVLGPALVVVVALRHHWVVGEQVAGWVEAELRKAAAAAMRPQTKVVFAVVRQPLG